MDGSRNDTPSAVARPKERRCYKTGIVVETGVFGAMMAVEIHNDGPVTLMLER